MTHRIHDRMTPARLAWLMALERRAQRRPRGPQGYQCMALGWTEWVHRHSQTGEIKGSTELRKLLPGRAFYDDTEWKMTGEEMLTPLGRKRLTAARKNNPQPKEN